MNEILLNWIRKKWIFYLLVSSPFFYLVVKILNQNLGANPLETILLYFGNSAVFLLLITLWISPLTKILPKFIPIRALNIHKRLLGVSAFIYTLFHFLTYLLDQPTLQVFLENFQKQFILIGFLAFFILFLLAATSFDFVIKKITKKNWKRIHRLVYLVIILLFFHITSKNKGNYEKALLLFLPLYLAELVRFFLYFKNKILKSRQ